ncbi:MAG: radical SAM family heme chaperone HemW [Deltaproteobacteria bacterium]|nr:radical SAM family heme chaperone HemW [Candidatus Anaeroferrophillacea bacterium]
MRKSRFLDNRRLSLYLHIPFCRSKCRYCAFFSVPVDTPPADMYLRAVLRQVMAESGRWSGRRLATIYIGGGTPSVMPAAFYEAVLSRLAALFAWDPVIEITLELNPADPAPGWLAACRDLGVNRFSLGAQTFSPAGLRFLGRRHGPEHVRRAVDMLRTAGVENISLDLIHSLPGQDAAGLHADIDAALALDPAHLSAYCLTVEPGTPLARDVAAGRVVPPDADRQAGDMAVIRDRFAAAGLPAYEISNFARPGRESRHNLRYWHLEDYWGLGPGAWSSRREPEDSARGWLRRWAWTGAVANYAAADFSRPVEEDLVSPRTAFIEMVVMGLRLTAGVNLRRLRRLFGDPWVDELPDRFAAARSAGLMELSPTRLRLTERGVPLADEVSLAVLE